MAELVWSEPALSDLDAIADYIALDNEEAARELVRRVFRHVELLRSHPESGPKIPELKQSRYRQLSEPPCRIFYRFDGKTVFILHIMRAERLLKAARLTVRNPRPAPLRPKRAEKPSPGGTESPEA